MEIRLQLQKLYIAVEKFGPSCNTAWNNYVIWSGLHRVKEIVGLDSMLNPSVLPHIKDNYWNNIVNEDNMLNFFTNFDFLLSQVGEVRDLNIIGTIKAPPKDVSALAWEGFTFCGYELLDQDNSTSALTNCGGFPEAFRNEELSDRGLIIDFVRAVQIQRDLKRLSPEEHHADCNIWAVFKWQGQTTEGKNVEN